MHSRRIALALLALVIPIAFASPASAHGDVRMADDRVALLPGGTVRYEGEVHYHRVVGRVAADGPVRLLLVEDTTGRTVLTLGAGDAISFNELIRCCDRPWTPHSLVVENVGEDRVTVTVRAGLVHDDLAVMVDGAESGTRESIVLLGAVWAAVLWRAARRRRDPTSLANALALFGGVTVMILALTVYGAVRYGAQAAPSLLAGLFELPLLPTNAIVSRASLLMAIAGGLWAWSGVRWVRAASSARRGPWLALGVSHLIVVAATALLVATAYDALAIPIASAAAAGGPVAVSLVAVRTTKPPANV